MSMIQGPVRVRFAPSPTGYLHIGGVRTALFNWLFARHYGGQFILRIEDTDEKRFVMGAADDLMASLRWVGIDWDEGPDIGGPHGPYVQSERASLGIYQRYAEQLLESGHAYMSFTTEAELEQMRAEAAARGIKAFRFRGPERDWTLDQMRELAAQGKPYTIRLKMPLEGTTTFTDLVRGGDQISVQNSELQDIVLIKTSGMPVYHMAHLVDDHLMQITHVMRSEEWVPSTPYHVQLYRMLGWEAPAFVHLPVVLRSDGRGKLSKRKDDVATNRFWERGYLPEAMFNYLALQGWSYDDHTELMTREEILERFSLERVQPSPARWNPEKLRDMNGLYIRKLSADEVAERITPFLSDAGLIGKPASDEERAYVRRLTPMIHDRLEELGEAPELLEFFFRDVLPQNQAGADAEGVLTYDPAMLIQKKTTQEQTLEALQSAQRTLTALSEWDEASLETALRALAEELGLKPGQLFGALRVAGTGRTVAPPLFETLAALGRERTLTRIANAIQALS
jgi:glutamyl-tRNA synthetase